MSSHRVHHEATEEKKAALTPLSERLIELSQSCHEQNWSRVHAIAEEVLLERDEIAGVNRAGLNCANNTGGSGSEFDSTSMLRAVDGKKNKADRASTKKEQLGLLTSPQTTQLSSCLGTASPLAWTCRYSAPSSTVRLVLELDPSAVRVCLPQLGTPLHECAGRARPLREFPMKRNPTRAKSKKREERQKKKDTNRVLSGLREWRRTVRALIHADEKLMKEDDLIAAREPGKEDDQLDRMSEVWRKNVQTLIKDNVMNIQKYKDTVRGGKSSICGTIDANLDEKPVSSSKTSIPITNRNPIRAGLAQDADGNTALHFMIRCAASPAFGGGRWQARQDMEQYNTDSDESDSSSEEADARAERGQHDMRYNCLDTCGKWDGVRWCMEAHLRRSERRLLRQRRVEEQLAIEDDIALMTKKPRPQDEGDISPVSKRVATVEGASGHCLDFESIGDGCILPAKRKSADDAVANSCKRGFEKKHTRSNRKKGFRTSGKYLDDDERQDCCFDPLLGAVCDLVHSYPDSVGTPDHREYEETPLIVAIKSNIYVLMEPEQQFPFLHPGSDGMLQQPGNGPANRSVGDGFALIGGGVLNAGVGVGGGFPIPFPQNNQSGRDRILMSVLRGHGRQVTKDTRQTRSICVLPPQKANSTIINGALDPNVLPRNTKDVAMPLFEGEDEESSVSGDSSLGVDEDDPYLDAFVPMAHERYIPENNDERGKLSRNRSHFDYQTALEYRIFCLVRIMLNAHPRAACLMISDYTPLHSAVFHGRSYDTIRILLEAEAQFRSGTHPQTAVPASDVIPTLPGPAMLCANTRGELPLHFGCMRNETARTIRLLAEADPRAALVRDASGRTPLRWLWIRFVDGLLDRFGGRDTQPSADSPSFYEHEGSVAGSSFPNDFPQDSPTVFSDLGPNMFVFDTEYIRRARIVDRTVDFLRMRHVPSSFEAVEYVAADHAITVLLKLKYLQQRRNRQLNNEETPSGDVNMSTKEEFILYAFEKFVALVYAAFVASEVEEQTPDDEKEVICSNELQEEQGSSIAAPYPTSRFQLWHSLPVTDCDKRFCLVHEACGSSRASCPAAVAKICMRLFPDQLHQLDDDGRLPLHRVALRGLGWEPPSVDVVDSRQALAANETLNLLREVLSISSREAASTYDKNNQLPLHCAVDSMVTSILMGSSRRASLHAEARVTLQTHRHKIVDTAITCLSDLLRANSLALRCKDGKIGLLPFMQAASFDHQHTNQSDVVKYVSDLSKRPGLNVGVGFNSMDNDVVEEDDEEADADHISIIYYLLREDPSAIQCI